MYKMTGMHLVRNVRMFRNPNMQHHDPAWPAIPSMAPRSDVMEKTRNCLEKSREEQARG